MFYLYFASSTVSRIRQISRTSSICKRQKYTTTFAHVSRLREYLIYLDEMVIRVRRRVCMSVFIYSLLKYSKSWMVAKSSPFSCLSFLSYLLLLDRARQLTKSCYTWSKWFTIEFQSIRRYPAYNKRSLRMSWKKFGAKNVPDDEWRFTRASLRGLSADFSSHDFVQNILWV